MSQGMKPASHTFQQTMDKTFHDLADCFLPPSYDDVNISKGKHLVNTKIMLPESCSEYETLDSP